MGYTVSIGVCTAPKNAVVKSHDGSVYSGTCTLIQPCDILHPTLKISGAITGGNMFSLLGRNYYITQSVINNGATYISGTVDALSSWSDSILGTSQYVTRCETDYNLMIPDNYLPVEISEIPSVERIASVDMKSTEGYVIGLTKCKNVNTHSTKKVPPDTDENGNPIPDEDLIPSG